jgi:VanZ family protein
MKKEGKITASKWVLFYTAALVGLLMAPFDFDLSPIVPSIKRLSQTNGVEISGISAIRSTSEAQKQYRAKISGTGISVEVWLSTEEMAQRGPAKIISYSSVAGLRSFALGQEGKDLIVRLRTTRNDPNGVNSEARVPDVFISGELMHLIATYDHGDERLYANGEMISETTWPGGEFWNWNPAYRLVLGNESTGNRPWKGRLFLVAIYNRGLSAEEITANYRAGRHFGDAAAASGPRVSDGLVALYFFEEIQGRKIFDRSGMQPPLDLEILSGQEMTGKSFLRPSRSNSSPPWREMKDTLGNVILFVPFGFLLHAFLSARYGQSVKTTVLTLMVGVLFSVIIESFQYFIVSRDSSLIDVTNNAIGTALGIVVERFDFPLFLRLKGMGLDTEKGIE